MSSEAGTTDDEMVLKLKKELSQSRIERDRLQAEKESFMIKKQEIKKLEEQLRDEIEANSRATPGFEEQNKSLKEALKDKWQKAGQVKKALNEFHAYHAREFSNKKTEAVNANEKLKQLHAGLKERKESCRKERDELDKLQSRKDKEWKDLIAFLQTCRKKSELTDDVKPLLQEHFDAYINKLQCGDDDYRMLNKYVRVVLQPSFAQKQNDMFAGGDFISPVSTAISNVLNSSLFCKRTFTDRDSKGKQPVGERVDNESEHPGDPSIRKKLWDFIIT